MMYSRVCFSCKEVKQGKTWFKDGDEWICKKCAKEIVGGFTSLVSKAMEAKDRWKADRDKWKADKDRLESEIEVLKKSIPKIGIQVDDVNALYSELDQKDWQILHMKKLLNKLSDDWEIPEYEK